MPVTSTGMTAKIERSLRKAAGIRLAASLYGFVASYNGLFGNYHFDIAWSIA